MKVLDAVLTCDWFRAGRAPLGEELPEAVCAVRLVLSRHQNGDT